MSLFGTQFSFSAHGGKCTSGGVVCARPQPAPHQFPKRGLLLGPCTKKTDSCKPCKPLCNDDDDSELCCQRSGFVNGQRVLRPWTFGEKCNEKCAPPPPCPKDACDPKKTKIIDCKFTECQSTLVKLLVHGGPNQSLNLFVQLARCLEDCCETEIALEAHSVTVGKGKCVSHCLVLCEFVQFDVVKETPSGAQLRIVLREQFAPPALLQTVEPCDCPVPFCIELEIWRRPRKEDCCGVEQVIAPPPAPVDNCECESEQP